MHSKLISIIFLVLCFQMGYSQTRTITGTIKNVISQKPVSGISVSIKGFNAKTKTSSTGEYSLIIPDTMKSVAFSNFDEMDIMEIQTISADEINIYLSESDLSDLSLEDLLKIKVSTVSKNEEPIMQSPGKIIVITRKNIEQRGYDNLLDIFQDLPGIDLSIAYGDTYYKAYWRGFRTGMADSWLFMIDGKVMNHLWYNYTNILIATPLSNIEQIEVVYGPASAIYGANAMTGVINIITKKDSDKDGVSTNVKLMTGSFENRRIDMNVLYKLGDFRISATTYYKHGNLDEKSLDQFEWTNPDYLKDRNLWGAYIDNPTIAGLPVSPQNDRSVNFNVMYKNIELGWMYMVNDNGYGINYPFDKMQISPKWVEPSNELFLKYKHEFSDKFSTTTLLRYRNCDVSNESTSVETTGDYGLPQKVAFGYWQSLNRSYSIDQDVNYSFTDYLSFQASLKYDIKELQRAYDLKYGEWLLPSDVVSLQQTNLFPEPYSGVFKNEKHDTWIEEGAYLHGKFNLSNLLKTEYTHIINAGIRYDKSSYYGENYTIRAGYVGKYNQSYLKVLYGEGYNEPAARQLYGGWAAMASNPNLKPETSRTYELELGHSFPLIDISINPYVNTMNNMVMEINKISINHGKMLSTGIDVSAKSVIKSTFFKEIQLWAYYSYIHTEEEKYKIMDPINLIIVPNGIDRIGDIANHKFHAGINLVYKDYALMLIGRYIGERPTVESNPLGKVDPYFTSDVNLSKNNFLTKKLCLSLKISNILNSQYSHAGIRKANSGDTPGYWDGANWFGSGGFYNSLLPQPGRAFYISVRYSI